MHAREIELKFSLDPETFSRLRRSKRLKALTVEAPRTRHLVSTYYDTKDGRLAEAGIAWRLRREGRSILQGIKTSNGYPGLSRGEWESAVKGALPDLDQLGDAQLASALRERLEGSGVEPKVKTDVRRTERRLKTARGDIVDAAFDTVVFSNLAAPEQSAVGHELELELETGDATSLFEVARPLVASHPLELSFVSKAEHAAHAGEPLKPFKAPHLKLPEKANAADALAIVLTQTMRHMTAHTALARQGDSPEAIHQIRVSLRRIRAALAVYQRAFKSERLALLSRRARDLGKALSPARDLDVFENEILSPAKCDSSNPQAAEALSAALAERRAGAWEQARAALSSADYRLLLLDLAEVALCGFVPGEGAPHPAAVPARDLASEALAHRFAKAKELGDHVVELTPAQRHEFRKELKKLRYVSELFASLFAKGIKRHFEMLSSLQDDLGHLNDVAVARRLLGEISAKLAEREPSRAQELAYTSGEITGWHVHRAAKCLKRAVKHWRKLAETQPFWQR